MLMMFDDPFRHPAKSSLSSIFSQKRYMSTTVTSNSMESASVASFKILTPAAVAISTGLSVFYYAGISARFSIVIATGSGEMYSHVILTAAAACLDIYQRVASRQVDNEIVFIVLT